MRSNSALFPDFLASLPRLLNISSRRRIFNLLVLLHIFNAAPTQHTPRLRRSWLGGSRTVNPGYSHQARLELSWPTRQFDLLRTVKPGLSCSVSVSLPRLLRQANAEVNSFFLPDCTPKGFKCDQHLAQHNSYKYWKAVLSINDLTLLLTSSWS